MTMSWPSTKTECDTYSGKWCDSTGSAGMSGGWCQMAGMDCPAPYKAGYMTCWDNSSVPSGSSCPTSPQNENDCTKLGKYWCKSQYSSTTSGWCQPNKCSSMPPSGQMTCPDGYSFASSLSNCPKNGSAAVPAPLPTPEQKFLCWDGTPATTADRCPKKQDDVTSCIEKGGTWCTDSAGMRSGYCAPKGIACSTSVNKPFPTEPKFEEKRPNEETPMVIPNDVAKQLENEKKQMLRELTSMERVFKKVKDEAALAKVSALREKIQQLVAKDRSIYDSLQAVRDEMDNLRTAFADANDKSSTINEPERDQKFKDRAFKQMQTGVKSFNRFLVLLRSKIARVEKSGVTIPAEFTDLVARANDLAASANAAKSYEELRDIMEQVPDLAAELNDWMPQLEQLARIPRVLGVAQKQVNAAGTTIKTATATAKRLKIDAAAEIEKMQTLLDEANKAVGDLKTGNVQTDDLMAYLTDNIIDKVQEIKDIADSIQTIANVKRYINQATADSNRYNARIVKMERAGEDMTEAKDLLAEFRAHLAEVKPLASKKITPEIADAILEQLAAMNEIGNQLEDILGLQSLSSLEAEIKKALGSGGEQFDQIKVDQFEQLLGKAFRTANFFRNSPYRNLALLVR